MAACNGLKLELPLGYSRFKGDLTTSMRGKVASPTARNWHIGFDISKAWQYGKHQIAPVAGVFWQNLRIHSFQDSDNAQVSYKMRNGPRYSGGLQYDYGSAAGTLHFGGEAQLIHRPGKANKTIMGDGVHSASFASGQGGDSIQLKAHAGISLTKNVKLYNQLQYQQRLGREGVNDRGITAGLKVEF